MQAAAEHGHMGCVTLILRSKPDQLDLSNALWTAAAHGHSEAVAVLLQAGIYHHLPALSRLTSAIGRACSLLLLVVAV